jgi:hypothetical protein
MRPFRFLYSYDALLFSQAAVNLKIELFGALPAPSWGERHNRVWLTSRYHIIGRSCITAPSVLSSRTFGYTGFMPTMGTKFRLHPVRHILCTA